jgi:peptidoglycan-N-acetylglucosamine deacetylase
MTNKTKALLNIGMALLAVLVTFGVTLVYSRAWASGFVVKPLSRLPTTDRVVALTFDDGPSRARTGPLLALLDRYDVKATFFMTGTSVEAYPAIAQNVLQHGHLIGNHSYSHQHLIFRSPSFIRTEIDRTDELIAGVGQGEVQLFRPPYCSKYLLLPMILKQKGKRLVTGTYDPPGQYRSPYDASLVARQVVSNIKPGAIIFLHDGNETYSEAFVESVGMIIEGLKLQGYSFVKADYGMK